MKTIGVIGAESWDTTLRYCTRINQEIARLRGNEHSVPLLIVSPDSSVLTPLMHEGRWDEITHLVCQHAIGLERAGANLIVLASDTLHVAASRIEEALSCPFIHVSDPTADALIADGAERVGLLGTRPTMEMGFYRSRLAAHGIEVVVPEVDHTNLDAIITEYLRRDIVTKAAKVTYLKAIDRLAAQGAQAIVLGCWEIGKLIGDDDSPLPLYDAMELHARAAVTTALA